MDIEILLPILILTKDVLQSILSKMINFFVPLFVHQIKLVVSFTNKTLFKVKNLKQFFGESNGHTTTTFLYKSDSLWIDTKS